MSYVIVWEYTVSLPWAEAFKAAYGPDGPWAHLFKRAAGFLDVNLLRCEDDSARYLTIDRWESRKAFEDFKRDFAAEYQALDTQLEGLASAEKRLGSFHELQNASTQARHVNR